MYKSYVCDLGGGGLSKAAFSWVGFIQDAGVLEKGKMGLAGCILIAGGGGQDHLSSCRV